MTVVEGLYSGLAAGSLPRGGRRLSTAGPAAQAAAAEAKMVRCNRCVHPLLMCTWQCAYRAVASHAECEECQSVCHALMGIRCSWHWHATVTANQDAL